MSGGEIIVILLVILILFGSEKMPHLARTVGKGLREFQKAKDEIQNELTRTVSDLSEGIEEVADSYQKEIDELKRDFNREISHSDDSSDDTPMQENTDGGGI